MLGTLINRASMRMRQALGVDFYGEELIRVALDLTEAVEAAMSESPYASGLSAKRKTIRKVLWKEILQFQDTVKLGVGRLEALVAENAEQNLISGETAFKLYDTYGLPFEWVQVFANEKGLAVDRQGFEAAMQRQQERSRAASQFGGDIFVAPTLKLPEPVPVEFV